MVEKQLKTRIVHKHDTEANWLKAENFIPKQGELIIYDRDQTHNYERFKFGNGVDVVSNLPFSDEATLAAAKAYTEEAVANIKIPDISSSAIVDITDFPSEGADENVIYRIVKASFYYNSGTMLYLHGNVLVVKELPETGLPCSNTGTDIATLYYNRSDNTLYAYVTPELGAALGAPAGWYPVTALMETLGYTYQGVVNSKEDITESDSFYTLVEKYYCAYSDGKYEVFDTLSVKETANIYLHNSEYTLDLQTVVANAYPGTSVELDVVDELIIENMQKSNMGEGATLHVYILESTGIGYVRMADVAVKLGVLLNQNANDTSDKGWTTDLSAETELGLYTVREQQVEQPAALIEVDTTLTQEGKAADAKAVGDRLTEYVKLTDLENLPADINKQVATAACAADLVVVTSDGAVIDLASFAENNGATSYVEIVDVIKLDSMKLSTLSSFYIYVDRTTGVAYVKANSSQFVPISSVLETFIDEKLTDIGWVTDKDAIETRKEAGIYTIPKFQSIIDTTKLPTTGVNTGVTYRVSHADGYDVDVYIMPLDIYKGPQHVENVTSSGVNVVTYVVKELPEQLKLSTITTSGTLYLYALENTGIVYTDIGTGTITFGQALFGQADLDKGLVENTNDISSTGIYCVRVPKYSYTYHIHKDGNWIDLVDGTTLFETVSIPGSEVGDTLTWDGNTDNRAYLKITSQGVGIAFVKGSESVPTLEDLSAGWSNTASTGQTLTSDQVSLPPNSEEYGTKLVETDYYICCTDMDAYDPVMTFPYIVKQQWNAAEDFLERFGGAASVEGNAVLDPGVYFVTFDDTRTTTSTKSFTINGYNFITSEVKKIIKPELLSVDETLTKAGMAADAKAVRDALADYAAQHDLFDKVEIPSEHVGDTITWNGELDGKEYWEYSGADSDISSIVRWVHISDSVPTYEELSAGFTFGELSTDMTTGQVQNYDTVYNPDLMSLTEDENCIDIKWNDLIITPVPHIVKQPHTSEVGIVYPRPGIYFGYVHISTSEGGGTHYNTYFTIPGYDFLSASSTKNVIKSELLPEVAASVELDATLTQEGMAADAKAVGNVVTELNNKINEITGEDSVIGTWMFNEEITSVLDVCDTPEKIQEWDDHGYYRNFSAYIITSDGSIQSNSIECVLVNGELYGDIYNNYIAFHDENWLMSYDSNIGWRDSGSRKIVVIEEPSPEIATWLRANAVKQSLYQAIVDTDLKTTDKTIVGAINELNKTTDAIIGKYSDGLAYGYNHLNNECAVSGIGSCTDTDIIIPSVYNGYRVTGINNYAFSDNTNIISVTIPDSVTSIGKYAFYRCGNLTNVVIGNYVTGIGSYAFSGCSNLTSITIPDSVTSIDNGAFNQCSKLTNIVIGKSVTTIGTDAFSNCNSLTNVVIPSSVTTIYAAAFEACTKLTCVTIPSSVTILNGRVFYNDNNLTIYCEAESQPPSWHPDWNASNCSVVWGAALDFASVNKVTIDKISEIDTWWDAMHSIAVDDVGISWENEFNLARNDGLDVSGPIYHKIPIVAGDNITFEVATSESAEEEVVKINATTQTPITYSELIALRDNFELVPGIFYRITDYQCTTTQADTRAMDHQFDIIVQALSADTLSENASADYHGSGKQTLNIEWVMSIGAGGYDGNAETVFVELGSEINNEGETVPVLYKELVDDETGETSVDYDDRLFYVGAYEFNGEMYDRWRFIETGTVEEGCHTWDNEQKKFMLTNIVVANNEFIISDASEAEVMYTMYDDDEGTYAGSGNHNDTFVEAGYKKNNDGVVVPVLYKTALESFPETDYEDTFYYVGQYVYAGETYDRWRKIEDMGYGWDEGSRMYALTNIVVEDNQFMEGVVEGGTRGYFKNANLPAWEIKYCLDNDATRFAWADEENGKGVIYYMKDEFNNECPYDFKNIQFIRVLDEDGNLDVENGEDAWCYTFGGKRYDRSIPQEDMKEYNNNSIGSYYVGCDERFKLPNNVFLGSDGCMTKCNKLGTNCERNTFGNKAQSNIFGDDSCDNTFGNNCSYNTVGDCCHYNTVGNYCEFNAFGNNCRSNNFGDAFCHNTFGNDCYGNTFGYSCNFNTFGNDCEYININGDNIKYIEVGAGVKGASNNYLQITPEPNADYQQIYRKSGSKEILI